MKECQKSPIQKIKVWVVEEKNRGKHKSVKILTKKMERKKKSKKKREFSHGKKDSHKYIRYLLLSNQTVSAWYFNKFHFVCSFITFSSSQRASTSSTTLPLPSNTFQSWPADLSCL